MNEICNVSPETVISSSSSKEKMINSLIKDTMDCSVYSKERQNSSSHSKDINKNISFISITENRNSSLNENLSVNNISELKIHDISNNSNNSIENEKIRGFLKNQRIKSYNNEYEEDDEDFDFDDYEDDDYDYENDDDDDEEENEDKEDDNNERDDDIETEFLDSDYEFHNYNNYDCSYDTNDEYELNNSLGIVSENNIGDYEYKNMIDVLRNLNYVVTKMKNKRNIKK